MSVVTLVTRIVGRSSLLMIGFPLRNIEGRHTLNGTCFLPLVSACPASHWGRDICSHQSSWGIRSGSWDFIIPGRPRIYPRREYKASILQTYPLRPKLQSILTIRVMSSRTVNVYETRKYLIWDTKFWYNEFVVALSGPDLLTFSWPFLPNAFISELMVDKLLLQRSFDTSHNLSDSPNHDSATYLNFL